eukprot:TRINITY_DN5840_c1_g1_i1.p1 TRINITY_DN5840_c1_g1~~TRINITY_DN5840_c1_g1_i1.p1  ORF type:complete len:218 (+),score=39.49 TRINITY_DN5840_c1_g1_i1:131-784(+)
MINEDMKFILDAEMVKLLSLVSRSLAEKLKQYIEDNFYFYLKFKRSVYTFYQPKNIQNVTTTSQINTTIKRVEFNNGFNEKIDFSGFTHLTHLQFGRYFRQPFENKLPPNLTYLCFIWYPEYYNSTFPSKLTHLHIYNNNIPFSNLPISLTHLFLSEYFNSPIPTLPPNTQVVTFKSYYTEPGFKQPVSHLNPNIKFIFEITELKHVVVKPYVYKPN